MKIILSILLTFVTINVEHRSGHPIDQNAYNVNGFTAKITALDAHHEFTFHGKATRIHNAWRQIQTVVNEMATNDSVPNNTRFSVVINWRKANFTRIVVAHRYS
jgi:hypothetical protein